MKKIVAGSTAVLLMLTASGALVSCKSAPDEPSASSDSSLESTSGVDAADASVDFTIDDDDMDSAGADDASGLEAEGGREGSQSGIAAGDASASGHGDEDAVSGFGNSYGLASGEGVNGDGLASAQGGKASEADGGETDSAPNDAENFPSTMERLQKSGKGTDSGDGKGADGDASGAAAADRDAASSNAGGSRQSAVAPNANDSSSAGLGDRSAKNKGGSGTGGGAGDAGGSGSASGADSAATASASGGTSGSGSRGNGTRNNTGGISGSSSLDGSRTANPTPTNNGTASGSGTGNGSKAASGSGSGTGVNGTNGKNGGTASGSGTASGANGTGSGTAGQNAGPKTDERSGGSAISTNGSGTGSAAAKDTQGLAGEGETDYVEKFSKWFHPALTDVQRCGYFYTTPEICQFDMIQGDFRKVSGYKKAAYGFVFGYSQPDARGYLSDYIRFEINVDGEYALYTWDGTTYTDLVESNDKGTAYFYEHPAIYKGYNTLNQIKIEDTGRSYNVYVNGKLIQGNIPYLNSRATKGVMAFFSVAKEHQEELPKTPVNVGMRITDVNRH